MICEFKGVTFEFEERAMDEKKTTDIPRRNEEGYTDLTPHKAIKNMEVKKQTDRVRKLVNTIFYICNLAGFEVVERIVLKDRKTGKIWR